MRNIEFENLGKDRVIISRDDFEDMLDALAYYDARAGQEEMLAGAVVQALIKGENPIRVFRKYRGHKQSELGMLAGVSQATIAELESGRNEIGGANFILASGCFVRASHTLQRSSVFLYRVSFKRCSLSSCVSVFPSAEGAGC